MEENDLFNFDDVSDQPIVDSTPNEILDDPADDNFEDSDYNDSEENSQDYVDMLLEAKGIKDRNVKIQNEYGEVVDTKFDDLSNQEKFDLLNYQEQPTMPSDEEINTINYLRSNGMSLQEFANWQRQEGVKEYLAQQTPQTDIDSYSDDEIIAYDFINRFGDDMSDEEIDKEIERLKEDEDAYEKRVDLLRSNYKNEELAQAQLYEQQKQQESQANQSRFVDAYNSALYNLNSIQGIELDDKDKNELYQFVLAKDPNNQTGFSKLMNDPEQVLKMAWFALHGEEAMNNVVDYFKKEISKRDRNSSARVVNKTSRQEPKDAFKFS